MSLRLLSLLLPLFICSFQFITGSFPENALESSLFINQVEVFDSLPLDKQVHFKELNASLSEETKNDKLEFFHILKAVNLKEDLIVLEDGSKWQIGWWYTGKIKKWKAGDRLKITYVSDSLSNTMKIQNIDASSTAWGNIDADPDHTKRHTILRIPNTPTSSDAYKKIVLQTGWIFQHTHSIPSGWKLSDQIFIFHNDNQQNRYDLWNLTTSEIVYNFSLVGYEKPGETPGKQGPVVFADLLNLEKKLNKRILSQAEATKAITASLLNYSIGLKDPKTPIGVFLFLGPTGVGKTELAKVLTDELYKTQGRLIRFDMSHFSDIHSSVRLIGSPPGYVGFEEGGQLTESLKAKPQSIVLLDEIEKAHQSVRKMFLPVFDEGYITDSKDMRIECENVIFIMTSNLCSTEIITLFQSGLDSDEVLQRIEPILMEHLSPELYNRVEPILFCPLVEETINQLVDIMLANIIKMLKIKRNIHLTIDETAKEYLRIHGFHPTLGARPLKKLIQKKISANISFTIINENIPNGSKMTLSYDFFDDSWHVNWLPAKGAID